MKYFMLLAGLCLAACNNSTVPAATDSIIPIQDSIVTTPADTAEEEEARPLDSATRVVFWEFRAILMHTLLYQTEDAEMDNVPGADTIFYISEPGQNMEGIRVHIKSDQLTEIKVEEQLQTSMMISMEEGLYELSDWKHGYTAWEELYMNEDSFYVCRSYSLEEHSIFPVVTLEEVKAAVKEKGGEEWLKFINDVKTVKDEPLEVMGDTYLLRVSGKRKTDGKIVSKVIVIAITLGC